jgi:hypothetical protein
MKWSPLLFAAPVSAHAAGLFGGPNPYSAAALILNGVGLVICLFAAAGALGSLAAAIWISIQRRARRHRIDRRIRWGGSESSFR